jgi:hypothetical protein
MPKPIDQALDDTSANLVLPGLNQVFSAKKKNTYAETHRMEA